MSVRRTGLVVSLGLLFVAPRTAEAGGPPVVWNIPTANSQPYGAAYGPDGKYWFTLASGNQVGRILIDDANALYPIDLFTIPTAGSTPQGLCAGPDGNLWFTEKTGNRIGRITTAGSILEYPLPTAGSQPQEICSGPDGALWFTEPGINKVGRISTAGAITDYPLLTASSAPFGIHAGSDGKLWVTLKDANKIASVTTSGTVTEYTIPTAASSPLGITRGSDNNLWFTESAASKVAKVTTAGVFTEFPLPVAGGTPTGIVSGPGGTLIFTERTGNRIGGITTSGLFLTSVDVSSYALQPTQLAFGAASNAWVAFTAPGSNAIARAYPNTTPPTPTPTPTATPTPVPPVGPMKEFVVAPCRVLDTRNPVGPYGGPALASNVTRTVILWGRCGISGAAKAVSLNVTVTGPTGAGFVTLHPSTLPRPLASTINFTAGQTRANNAVVRLGTDGGIDVFGGLPSGSTHFILDATGYFE